MPSEPVTQRPETTTEKRTAVWTWCKAGKSYSEVGRLEGLTKSTVAKIIQHVKATTGEDKFSNKIRPGRPPKLTLKAERRILRAAANDTHANLACLRTPSQSGKKLSRPQSGRRLRSRGRPVVAPARSPICLSSIREAM